MAAAGGFGWLADNHPESLECDYAVNEGGGTPVEIGNSLVYALGTGEKGRLEIHIRFRGDSAPRIRSMDGHERELHSRPGAEGHRAVRNPKLDTSLPIFDHLSEFAIEEQASPANINSIVEQANGISPRLGSMLRALSRMTLTPTMIKGGIKSNSVPEVFRTHVRRKDPAVPGRSLRKVAVRQSFGGHRQRRIRCRLHVRSEFVTIRDGVGRRRAARTGSRGATG